MKKKNTIKKIKFGEGSNKKKIENNKRKNQKDSRNDVMKIKKRKSGSYVAVDRYKHVGGESKNYEYLSYYRENYSHMGEPFAPEITFSSDEELYPLNINYTTDSFTLTDDESSFIIPERTQSRVDCFFKPLTETDSTEINSKSQPPPTPNDTFKGITENPTCKLLRYIFLMSVAIIIYFCVNKFSNFV